MINLVKKLKSVIAVFVFSIGALVASQAYAYTYDDYMDAVSQVSAAQAQVDDLEDGIYSSTSQLDVLLIQGDSNYANEHCGGNPGMTQGQYNDCINDYIREFNDLVDNLNSQITSQYAELGWAYFNLSEAEALRSEIAAALGL